MRPTVERLDVARLPEAVAVHCDAFFDYPTMPFVLGDDRGDYAERLAALIGFFLESTLLKGGVAFGVTDGGELAAAADAVHSNATEPEELASRRHDVWRYLGPAARGRYEEYSRLTASFAPNEPHYYLSMLGVRRSHAGRGLARPLLEAVRSMSEADPTSTGVALETEDPRNLPFYEHFGYRRVGHREIAPGVESWGFFRPDDR